MINIEAYVLKGRRTSLKPTFHKHVLTPERKALADKWLAEHSGWKNSWVAHGENLVLSPGEAVIEAGTSRYADQMGIIEAIRRKQHPSFGAGGLSVAIYPRTADGYFLLLKRGRNYDHVPHVYMTPCTWMSTINTVGQDRCEEEPASREPVLYDPMNLARKLAADTLKLERGEFEIAQNPDSLVRASQDSMPQNSNVIPSSYHFGIEFFCDVLMSSAMVVRRLDKDPEKTVIGLRHGNIGIVRTGSICDLLRNQVELQKEDPATFEPRDDREFILAHHMIGGFVYALDRITHKQVRKEIIEHLRKGGIDISERQTDDGTYELAW